NAYCMRSLTTPFFFNHPTTHGSYTLSLHDALPISSRLRPEDQLDRSCQGASRLADAPGSEPRRAASSRRTVPARKARGHRTGASALRSDLTGELAENEPDPVSPLVIGERDTRLGVVRHAIDLH